MTNTTTSNTRNAVIARSAPILMLSGARNTRKTPTQCASASATLFAKLSAKRSKSTLRIGNSTNVTTVNGNLTTERFTNPRNAPAASKRNALALTRNKNNKIQLSLLTF